MKKIPWPPLLSTLIDELMTKGYNVLLVGGAVRDFILTGQLAYDLDFEISAQNSVDDHDLWLRELKGVFKDLEDQFEIEILNFNIYRIKTSEGEWEFSTPRVEKFIQDDEGHSNFEAVYFPKLEYNESFLRRDLTINAIGIEYDTGHYVDPFAGRVHLKNKLLVPCAESFKKDPVRFLRAMRFKIKLGCEYSDEILKLMKEMKLTQLSNYYFLSEAIKSKNVAIFCRQFFDFTDAHKIPLNSKVESLRFLVHLKETQIPIKDVYGLFYYLVFNENITNDNLKEFCQLASIKKQTHKIATILRSLIESFDNKELEVNFWLNIEDADLLLKDVFYSFEFKMLMDLKRNIVGNEELWSDCIKNGKTINLEFFSFLEALKLETDLGRAEARAFLNKQDTPKDQWSMWYLYFHLKEIVG